MDSGAVLLAKPRVPERQKLKKFAYFNNIKAAWVVPEVFEKKLDDGRSVQRTEWSLHLSDKAEDWGAQDAEADLLTASSTED